MGKKWIHFDVVFGYSKLVRLQISQWQHCFIPSSATLLLFRVFSHFSFMPNVQYVQSVKYCLLLQRHFNSCKTSLTLQLPLYCMWKLFELTTILWAHIRWNYHCNIFASRLRRITQKFDAEIHRNATPYRFINNQNAFLKNFSWNWLFCLYSA